MVSPPTKTKQKKQTQLINNPLKTHFIFILLPVLLLGRCPSQFVVGVGISLALPLSIIVSSAHGAGTPRCKALIHYHYQQHLLIRSLCGQGGVRHKKSKGVGVDRNGQCHSPQTTKQTKHNSPLPSQHSTNPPSPFLSFFFHFRAVYDGHTATFINTHNNHPHSFLFIFPKHSYLHPLPIGTGVFFSQQIASFLRPCCRTLFLGGDNNKPLIGLPIITITI